MRRPPAVLVSLAALAALRALHRGGMENRGGLECGLAAAGAVAVDGVPLRPSTTLLKLPVATPTRPRVEEDRHEKG